MDVIAPEGTNETVYIPIPLRRALGKYNASSHGLKHDDSSVVKGDRFTFQQVEQTWYRGYRMLSFCFWLLTLILTLSFSRL